MVTSFVPKLKIRIKKKLFCEHIMQIIENIEFIVMTEKCSGILHSQKLNLSIRMCKHSKHLKIMKKAIYTEQIE